MVTVVGPAGRRYSSLGNAVSPPSSLRSNVPPSPPSGGGFRDRQHFVISSDRRDGGGTVEPHLVQMDVEPSHVCQRRVLHSPSASSSPSPLPSGYRINSQIVIGAPAPEAADPPPRASSLMQSVLRAGPPPSRTVRGDGAVGDTGYVVCRQIVIGAPPPDTDAMAVDLPTSIGPPSPVPLPLPPPDEFPPYPDTDDFDFMRGVARTYASPNDVVPLVVIDGANLSYAYAAANRAAAEGREMTGGSRDRGKIIPDARGALAAARYFQKGGCRVLCVLPAGWAKASAGGRDNYRMARPELEALRGLRADGLLCASPPADDDDSYVLAIARRANARVSASPWCGTDEEARPAGGYVLSNDMFRDAMAREEAQALDGTAAPAPELRLWLNGNDDERAIFFTGGRISYAFCDMGEIEEDGGGVVLDFVPNPRHVLVAGLETSMRQGATGL